MNSIEKAIAENNEFELAKEWLNKNGIFSHWELDTLNNKSLDSRSEKTTHKITFQKKGSTVIKTDKGDDFKKLVIDMYRAES